MPNSRHNRTALDFEVDLQTTPPYIELVFSVQAGQKGDVQCHLFLVVVDLNIVNVIVARSPPGPSLHDHQYPILLVGLKCRKRRDLPGPGYMLHKYPILFSLESMKWVCAIYLVSHGPAG